MILQAFKSLVVGVALVATCAIGARLPAQDATKRGVVEAPTAAQDTAVRRGAPRTATIHWQRVPLRDALGRLGALFEDVVFVDRRVDPNLRVTLDIEASSSAEVVEALAAANQLGVGRLGRVIYLGPSAVAEQLRPLVALRAQEVSRLPAELRSSLARKVPTTWPRLAEPRQLITTAVEQRGWRITGAEQIPHDLWAAGKLPELTLAEQLTVLLAGFDLTFELRPETRTVAVVPLEKTAGLPRAGEARARLKPKADSSRPAGGTRQVYTLRVQEQPVGAVLKQLSARLHWAIDIDEAAIQAAGRSLDKRVSFAVEDADQDKLLDALLTPAGLEYQREGDRVRVVPQRYGEP